MKCKQEAEVAVEILRQLKMPELCDICPGELHTGSDSSPRETCGTGSKATGAEPSKPIKVPDTRHVFPAGFQPCFGPVFSHYTRPSFRNRNVQSVDYILEDCNLLHD